MIVKDYFENKLPIIAVTNNGLQEQYETVINLQSSPTEGYTGSFVIKNIGTGTLQGSIYTDGVIVFEQSNFNGNITEARYSLNLNLHSPEIIHTEAVIVSNGGEHTIRFIINVKPPTIYLEGFQVDSIESFYKLWTQNPVLAKKIFIKHDFYLWLYAINYEYMDIYEQFRNDPNKERGINNFFVFNKLKEPAVVSLYEQNVKVVINPFKNERCTGKITVRRQFDGFTDETIECNAPWVKLSKNNITAVDFKSADEIEIPYEIDKSLVNRRVQHGEISLKTGNGKVHIKTTLLNFMEVSLSNNYACLKEELFLHIKNNTRESLKIEITPEDNFIKFEKSLYIVENEESIPFNIRLSTLQLAQKSIRKRPVFQSVIRVNSHYGDKKFFQDIKLLVGDFR